MIAGLLLPAIVGVVGLATEAGLWYFKHQSMQAASDSSAISAAVASVAGVAKSNLPTEAAAVAASYGFVSGSNSTTVTLNMPPKSGTHISTPGAIEVVITQPQSRIFSVLWSSAKVNVTARSVAVPGRSGTGCVLSLDGTEAGDVTDKGSASVVLNGCSLYDNSGSSTALTMTGSATLTALSVGIVGNFSSGGASNITTTNGITTGGTPVSDPYANTSYPPFSGCNYSSYSANSSVTLNPGVYCGGMSLNAGAVVTLNPGIYYLDQGSLSVNGGATLQGTGVTIVFTSSSGSNYATATINGGATINLTAPTSGATAGIVFFGDRNMPVGTSFKFNGGSSQVLGGAVYLPKAAVNYTGGATSGGGCTQLIADSITFSGNSNLANNCTG